MDADVNKSDEYWDENRFENLTKDELGVYKCWIRCKRSRSLNKFIVRFKFWQAVLQFGKF
jgi:hypothetical protein